MGVSTSHSSEESAPFATDGSGKAELSARVRPILDDVIAAGNLAEGTRQLVTLLRGRDYSIADLLRDLKAAKSRGGNSPEAGQRDDLLDKFLVGFIEQTSAVYKAAIESLLHGFCELTADGRIMYANPALLALLPGCEGQPLARYFPKNTTEIADALGSGAGKRTYRVELQAHDQLRPVLLDFGPMQGGATAHAFITDLTDAREAEHRALDTAPFAILKLDPDHRITYANEPASRLLGGTPKDVVGRDAGSLVHGPEDAEALEREYEERRKGKTSEYELDVQPIDQSPTARVVVRSIPETDPEGQLASTFVTLSPITAELTAQRILEEVSVATDAGTLFTRFLDQLRPLVAFDTAILSVYTRQRSFSRTVLSWPALNVDDRWIPVPEAFRGVPDAPAPFGADLEETIRTTPGGEGLFEQAVVRELFSRGLHGWYALAIRDPDQDAVLSLLHKDEDHYNNDTTAVLDKVGARHALQAVLRLDAARERDFQFRLLKSLAQTTTHCDIARLIVTRLAEFYGLQNVSIFKVNAFQQQFELIDQAKSQRGGFFLPTGYRQSLDRGYLGKTYREEKVQIVGDASKSPEKEAFVEVFVGTRSEMCVPIWLEGKIVWILNLEDKRPHVFEGPEKETVERLMDEVETSLERALSSTVLNEVLDAVPDAVVITDLTGKILKCNLSARDMLGGEPAGEPLAAFFAEGSEGADAVTRETTVAVRTTLVGLDKTETNVLVSARVPSEQYDRRVVFMQDCDKLNWQAETRQLMKTLADVASQIRVPLSLASSFVRQIGRQVADQAPRLVDMANHAVQQLGRVELTYGRVIEQAKRVAQPEAIDIDDVLATVVARLPADCRDRIQCRVDPVPPVWTDRGDFVGAANAMLAYLLRIGDAGAPIDVRARVFGDAIGISMSKPLANPSEALGATGGANGPGASPADEALARWALDEPGLYQFAFNNRGLFRRRRTIHGETLRLVLRTEKAGKEAPCTTV